MFGILRPCSKRLGPDLRAEWTAHLCGMCLALRDDHGHLARVVTNYDAIVLSALVDAQRTAPERRAAGPCPLRGMRTASVAQGDAARLAASVSLLLAAAKIDDHVADGDIGGGGVGGGGVGGGGGGGAKRRVAAALSSRWVAAGSDTARHLGLDAPALLAAVADQPAVERRATSILDVTAPTEAATALAFRQTAQVAGRAMAGRPGAPLGNPDALAEAGRLFGRLAHLLDAVEDLHADRANGAWNPIDAFALGPDEVRRLCDDAVLGIRLALNDLPMTDGRLVHQLLVHETREAVQRAFGTARQPAPPPYPPSPPGWPPPQPPLRRRNPVLGCVGWIVACGTCQVCCANEFEDPCTGQRREGWCRNCDCSDCGSCCDGDCCDCCGGCDCSC